MNSLMVLSLFPTTSALMEKVDLQFSLQLKKYYLSLIEPSKKTFGGKYFGRAYLKTLLNESYLYANNQSPPNKNSFLELESQPWGLLSNLLDSNQSTQLALLISADLNSPIGFSLTKNGMVISF